MPATLTRLLPVLATFALATLTSISAQQPPDLAPDHAAKMAKGTELFKASVRGILQNKCVKCHSGVRLEGDLDLNTRDALLKGGARGPAIVPGEHKKSLLWLVTAHEKEPHMPHERAKLPGAEIQKIADWIDLGAPYDKPFIDKDETAWTRKVIAPEARKHWAFQPLRKDLRNPRPDCSNPLDGYITAKLEEAGLKANPPADKRTLIRRVYLDLIGLPPTPEQVDAFLADHSPQAFEKVVDSLLASPRFGEKWARQWLDLVRFAESHGFEHDYDRPTAYHYRDFVIKALNQDLSFDSFTRWQIAGDELAPSEPLAMMATGYLAAGVHSTQITANEVEKHRYDELDDILGNIGTTFLGLTVGCARCHDHKYDAIPSRDYYRMLSAFTTAVRAEADLDLDPAGYAKAKAAFDGEHASFVAAVSNFEKNDLPAHLAKWERARGEKPMPLEWVSPRVVSVKSAGGATLANQPDGSILVSGKNPTTETLTFELITEQVGIRSMKIEALTHPSLVRGGPGRATNGNFALSDVRITAQPANSKPGEGPDRVKLLNARATFEQKGLPVSAAIDESVTTAWAIDPQFGKDHAAVFDFEKPIGFPGGTLFTITLSFNNNTGHGLGRPRLSLSTLEKPSLTSPTITDSLRSAIATPAAQRTPEQTAAVLKWYAPQDAEYQKLQKAERDHLAKAPKPNVVKSLICSEGVTPIRLHSQGADFLKETHFLSRGDSSQKKGVAPLSFLQALMPDAEAQVKWIAPPPTGAKTSYRRAAFANWLTDTRDGAGQLVARVIANRLWQQHFGRGLVATVSDFGIRGDAPSHPELLDYLASELIRGGWKLKPIHRLIVTSAAYQQSSLRDEEKARADPENKLIWRAPVRRLPAEAIRDSILFVGGRLNTTMFGPGTLSEESTRRSIYFTMKRSKLIPSLIVFDAPDGTVGVGERPATTIAPQALHLMNNPQVRGSAHGFARRVLANASIADANAIELAYRMALCREPTASELGDAVPFIAGKTGEARETAVADFCQVLFCMNEFLYLE